MEQYSANCRFCDLLYDFDFGVDVYEMLSGIIAKFFEIDDKTFFVPAWYKAEKTMTTINIKKPYDKSLFIILAKKKEHKQEIEGLISGSAIII